MIEGFEYGKHEPEFVALVLNKYLADTSLERLSYQIDDLTFAGAQRIVDEAVRRGVISKEDKHKKGGGFAIKRAKKTLERHPDASPPAIARLAGCSEATVYRARKNK